MKVITSLFKKDKPFVSDKIYIHSKTIAFAICSVISAFINLVFISNLTKSDFGIGTLLSLPAAVLLGILSVALDITKCLHAININTLKDLQREMEKFKWDTSKLRKTTAKWMAAYIMYVILSIFTSVSLSSISIGAGITRNANTIKQVDEYIQDGQKYVNINTTTTNIALESRVRGVDVDNKNNDAQAQAQNDANAAWARIEPELLEYQALRSSYIEKYGEEALKSGYEHTPESQEESDALDAKNKKLKATLAANGYAPGSTMNGDSLSKLSEDKVVEYIKKNKIKNNTIEASSANLDKLSELKELSVLEAYSWLKDVNKAGFINPRTGNALVVEIDENKDINMIPTQVSSAIKELKALKVDIENDSGDIGSSSKIFMQLGSLFESKKHKEKTQSQDLQTVLDVDAGNSFGSTELMMMLTLLFLSLLCELAINQFSPKLRITEKTLNQNKKSLPEDFDTNKFMLSVLSEQCDLGEISLEEYDFKRKEALTRMLEKTKEKFDIGKISKQEFTKEADNILERMFTDSHKIIEDYKKKMEAPTVAVAKIMEKVEKQKEAPKLPVKKAEAKPVSKEAPKPAAKPVKEQPKAVKEQPKPKPAPKEAPKKIQAPVEEFEFDKVEQAEPKQDAKKILVKTAEKELEELLAANK